MPCVSFKGLQYSQTQKKIVELAQVEIREKKYIFRNFIMNPKFVGHDYSIYSRSTVFLKSKPALFHEIVLVYRHQLMLTETLTSANINYDPSFKFYGI